MNEPTDQHPQSVQGTNDDSIVSKRSAARFKYINDEFLRCYTPNKAPRRSPLINRGYYIRCKLIRTLLSQFVAFHAGGSVQVVSLGAGFDTSFWVLKSEGALKAAVHWFETDFAEVVSRKAAIIRTDKLLGSQVKEVDCNGLEEDEIHSEDYTLIKGDLRDLLSFRNKLVQVGLDFTRPTLVFAECVMTYMNPEDSNRVISWAAQEFPSVAFLTYEQIVPYDAFGHVMRNTLLRRRSPLLGIYSFPTLSQQRNRYLSLGFDECNIATLLEFYHSLGEEEIERVEHLEEFDEFEEWFIKSQHYFVSVAVKGIDVDPALGRMRTVYPDAKFSYPHDHDYTGVDTPEIIGDEQEWIINLEPKNKSSLHKHATTRQGHTSTLVQGVSVNGVSEVIVVFGGQCHDRLDDLKLLLLGASDLTWKSPTISGAVPMKRVFHAAVSFAPGRLLVISGRTSPRRPLDDIYCLNMETMFWEKWELRWEGEARPLNRWRHTATLVIGGESHGNILIFGGRSIGAGHNEFLDFDDTLLLDPKTKVIKELKVTGSVPTARYSHTMSAIGNAKLVLFGGSDNKRVLYNDVHVLDVDTGSWMKIDASGDIPFPVFSHTANPVTLSTGKDRDRHLPRLNVYDNETPTHLLVLGGCSPLSRNTVHYLDLSSFKWTLARTMFSTQSGTDPTSLTSPVPVPPSPLMFVKHSATLVSPNRLCVLGGGALCFSFGNFYNSLNILKISPQENEAFPFLGKVPVKNESEEKMPSACVFDWQGEKAEGTRGDIKILSSPSREDIETLIRLRNPAILRGLDFGSCKSLWSDVEYLRMKETKKFSAREFTDENLDFLNKNYDFKMLPFPELIDIIFPAKSKADDDPKRYYFRTIGEDARKQPSDIRTVVPELAKDFKIPELFTEASEREFSSILRLSSKHIRVWTHYDVMDNILCQVVGRKTVTLWHPSEVTNLYVNGSTSQVLDINNPDLARFPRFKYASCLVGTLLPGDVLFIPSLWFHNTWTEDPAISINVFFKHLSDEQYEAKDLYGNRDLVVAEQAMTEVTKACERLGNLPAHYSQFYLRKLLDIVGSHLSAK